MLKSYKFILSVFLCQASGKDIGGLGGSISQDGVNSMTSILTPYIFANIKDVKIPEIDFDGGNLKNIDINIPSPTSMDDINLDLVNADNALELVAKDLQATLNADFTYKYIVTVGGQAKVDIKKMNIDLELALSTQPGTPATDLAPMITVSKVDVSINPDDIDITLSGSLVSKIASIFIPFFKSTIIPLVVNDLEDQVKSIVNGQVDKDLAEYGTQAEIPYLAGVTFDYGQLNSGILVSTDSILSGSVNGTFFDSEKVQASAYTPTPFANRDPNGKMLQAYISDYVLNTAFEAGFLTGNTLDITYLLEKYLNVTVTTDNLGVIIPEILTKYGSGKAVGLAGKFVSTQTESKFTTQGQTLGGSLAVTVSVNNETSIQVEFDQFALAAVLSSDSGAIYGNISQATAGSITNFTNNLGLDAELFLAEVQGSIDDNIATLNKVLVAGLVIPTVMGIDISDLDLDFYDGYLEFGISVSPSFWGTVWNLMGLPEQQLMIQNEESIESIKYLQY